MAKKIKNPFVEKLIRDNADFGMSRYDVLGSVDVRLMESEETTPCPCGGTQYYYHPVGANKCSTCGKYDFQW
jgi:hypothetical protein